MTKTNVWVAGWAMPVMIAMLLLLGGSFSARANGQPSAATAEVKIDNFSFTPQTLTVAVGTTVTWTNRDDIPHTVVSTDGVFKSKVRDTDEKFSYTFTKAGTYPYFCSVHPKMTGKIVVQWKRYRIEVFSPSSSKYEPDRRCDPRHPSGYSAADFISMGFIPTPKLAALVKNAKAVSDQVELLDATFVAGGQGPITQRQNHH